MAKVNEYRAGIIGCGVIGSFIEDTQLGSASRFGFPNGHAACYDAMHETELVCGADTDAGRRDDYAKRWNLPADRVYADYRDLLKEEDLYIVSIATPSPIHEAPALAAVEAGVKAIFLEKPIASNIADARKVIKACDDAGIALAVNHTRRGDFAYRQAKQLIDDGAIGDVHTMIVHFSGELMFIGSHAFDLLNYFNGDCPVAWMNGHLDDHESFDAGGNAYMVYENGVRAFVNGTTGHAVGFRAQVIGTAGEIIIGNYDLQLWRVDSSANRRELVMHPFPQVYRAVSPMVALIEELIETSHGGPTPISSGPTALGALQGVVGLHQSSNNGSSRVTLADLDENFDIPSK